MRGVLAAVVGVLVFASGVMAEPPVRDDEAGWWEAELHIARVPSWISFSLWIPGKDDDRTAYIRNADEYIEVMHEMTDEHLILDFPHFDSRIVAEQTASNEYEGSWRKTRSDGDVEMRFSARRRPHFSDFAEAFNFDPEEALPEFKLPADVVLDQAVYAMEFESSGRARGKIRRIQARWSARLTGTIETPTGDYRYLSGINLRSCQPGIDRYILSVFDGAHAFLFTADVNPDTGDLTNGHFYSGNHWHETFTARRLAEGEEFELPDPFSEVSLKPGVTRLGLPKLNEAPYAGKPVIVQVMGTWCPNCHDEAAALVDLYETHRADGLQILSLCYEYSDDGERSARQIDRFKERHGATWEFVAAGTSDKTKAAATLPALSSIKSYPTTIWVNPDGTVRAIHSGFSGPATGEKHEETLAEFARLTQEIVEAQ